MDEEMDGRTDTDRQQMDISTDRQTDKQTDK